MRDGMSMSETYCVTRFRQLACYAVVTTVSTAAARVHGFLRRDIRYAITYGYGLWRRGLRSTAGCGRWNAQDEELRVTCISLRRGRAR